MIYFSYFAISVTVTVNLNNTDLLSKGLEKRILLKMNMKYYEIKKMVRSINMLLQYFLGLTCNCLHVLTPILCKITNWNRNNY